MNSQIADQELRWEDGHGRPLRGLRPRLSKPSLSSVSTVLPTVLFLLLLIATALRIAGLNRGLWGAEAWVANSAISERFEKVFYYDGWLQTTPPLFLVLVRGAVSLFHLSNWSLRIVPLLLGLGCVAGMAGFSFRAFRPPLAILCTSLVALSPAAIAYSKELKQYSGDAAATAVLLLLLWRYKTLPSRARYIHLLSGFVIGCLLSYSAVMLLPLACIVLVAMARAESQVPGAWRKAALRGFGLGLLVAVEVGLIYVVFVKPNLAPNLHGFWLDRYPHGTVTSLAEFYTTFFVGMPVYLLAPLDLDSTSLARGDMRLPFALMVVAGTIGLAVVAYLFVQCRRERQRIWLAGFALAPILTLIAVNGFHLYPVSRRLALFLLPCVSIGAVLLFDAGLDAIGTYGVSATRRQQLEYAITFAVIGLMIVGNMRSTRTYMSTERDEEAIAFLRRTIKPNDVLYVHASMIESARLEFRMLGWHTRSVIFGNTGYSCCTRNADPVSGDGILQKELSLVIRKSAGRDAWLLITGRPEPWPRVHREVARETLLAAGCHQIPTPRFTLVEVLRFACHP